MTKKADLTAPALSTVFMGLGQIFVLKQYIKGILFFLFELVVLLNTNTIIKAIKGLITLGGKPHLPVAERDNSTFMMLDGLIAVVVIIIIVIVYIQHYRCQKNRQIVCQNR